MALSPISELRDVHGIEPLEKQRILDYMQGAVRCWDKNRKGDFFAAHDLVGGENRDWNGTPLLVLYEKHTDLGKDNESAIKDAGKDIGWLLKAMLAGEDRLYEVLEGRVNSYRWDGNEP